MRIHTDSVARPIVHYAFQLKLHSPVILRQVKENTPLSETFQVCYVSSKNEKKLQHTFK